MKRTNREAAEFVIEKLVEQGFTALLAGGCVRDMLLNRSPKDHDVATDAPPDAVSRVFKKTDKVGAKFGVVLVRLMGHQIEVATFRTDGSYSDGRHPDSVTFGTLEEDAERRDFTINGMYYDVGKQQVIDLVGGQDDLKNRVIRAIGDPQKRFAEDHLRLLRAVRFAVRCDFSIEEATATAIQSQAHHLPQISTERVREELRIIFNEPTHAAAWSLITSLGLADYMIPNTTFTAKQQADISRRLTALPDQADFVDALTILLRHLDPKSAETTCHQFTCSNAELKTVGWLLTNLPHIHDWKNLELADIKFLLAHPDFERLTMQYRADLVADGQSIDPHQQFLEFCAGIPTDQIAPPPFIIGDDLLRRGVPQGPQYARILRALYRSQLNNELYSRNDAETRLAEMLNNPTSENKSTDA